MVRMPHLSLLEIEVDVELLVGRGYYYVRRVYFFENLITEHR